MVKEIQLTQGYVALVDDADYERVAAHKWHAHVEHRLDGTVRVYARRNVPRPGGGWAKQFLHRFVIDAPDGLDVDHIDGDTRNNRRENMRLCTRAENTRNQWPLSGCSSAHKGVTWHKRDAKWQARIRAGGVLRSLGYFSDEVEAAQAYDQAAKVHFGEFARPNFPGTQPTR